MKRLLLLAVLPMFLMGNTDKAHAQKHRTTQVIAHRCFHENGSNDKEYPENSLAAFKRAQNLGIWGAEIDVWITPDDVVVVNHNATVPTDKKNRKLEFTDYENLKDIRLANGEVLPTLESLLQAMKESSSDMKLVLEIKSHAKKKNNERVVNKSIELVRKYGLENQVVWIAFSYDNCKMIVSALPDAMVMYLNGDKTPKSCFKDGIRGIDYHMNVTFKKYVRQAHKLGMVVNCWTVNSVSDMNKFLDLGVDYITTNEPDVLKELISKKR